MFDDDLEDQSDLETQCPNCNEWNTPIGMLGITYHYTCRWCGSWFAVREVQDSIQNEGV